MSLLFHTNEDTNEEEMTQLSELKAGSLPVGNNAETIYADRHYLFPATTYFAVFFAAATDSTITISPITLPFTVALSPASLSSSASCPSSV